MSSPAFEDSVLTLWPPRVSPNEMACHSSSLSKLSSPPHGHSLPLEYERAFLLFILSLLLSHMGLSQPILPSLSPFCATSPKSTHPQRLSANSGPSIETPLTLPAPTEILLWPFLSDPFIRTSCRRRMPYFLGRYKLQGHIPTCIHFYTPH